MQERVEKKNKEKNFCFAKRFHETIKDLNYCISNELSRLRNIKRCYACRRLHSDHSESVVTKVFNKNVI